MVLKWVQLFRSLRLIFKLKVTLILPDLSTQKLKINTKVCIGFGTNLTHRDMVPEHALLGVIWGEFKLI